MKFLIDEDVPVKLIEALNSLGHDAIRAKKGTPDPDNANRTKEEGRIFITLDKDFTNRSMYSPNLFNIIHIQIHPPYAEAVIDAVGGLLKNTSPTKLKGLIVLRRSGPVFFKE